MKLTLRMNAASTLIKKPEGLMKKKNKMMIVVVSNEGDFYDLIIYNYCNAIYNYACMTFERLILLEFTGTNTSKFIYPFRIVFVF